LHQPLAEAGLVVIGLNAGGDYAGDDEARIRKFIDETGVTFPVGVDHERSYDLLGGGAGVSPFPLDVVIDRQGNIRLVTREYDPDHLASVIAQAL
jgi:peroxiredoxin